MERPAPRLVVRAGLRGRYVRRYSQPVGHEFPTLSHISMGPLAPETVPDGSSPRRQTSREDPRARSGPVGPKSSPNMPRLVPLRLARFPRLAASLYLQEQSVPVGDLAEPPGYFLKL